MRRTKRLVRGAIAPVAVSAVLILCVLAIGGSTVARLIAARSDAQRMADAAAAATVITGRERGKQQTLDPVRKVGVENTPFPLAEVFGVQLDETPGALVATATARIPIRVPMNVFGTSELRVQAKARAFVPQILAAHTVRPPPNVVAVLDYSGSMVGTREQSLEQAMAAILADRMKLHWAAVFFSATVLGEVDFDFDDPDAVEADIRSVMQSTGANGGTNTELGIARAHQFLRAAKQAGRPGANVIMLVSDGEPNNEAAATAAATAFVEDTTLDFGDAQPRIVSLHIAGNNQGFMLKVAGTRSQPGDWDYYTTATGDNDEEIIRKIRYIVAQIICPPIELDRTVVHDFSTVSVFSRASAEADERRYPKVTPGDDGEGVVVDDRVSAVRFTYDSCVKIDESTPELVIRYNHAVIAPPET